MWKQFTLRDLFWLATLVGTSLLAWRQGNALQQYKAQQLATTQLLQQNELVQRIQDHGGMQNVHYLQFVYSRWYGTEAEIGFVDDTPRQKWKVAKGRITNADRGGHYPTKYGWYGSTMLRSDP